MPLLAETLFARLEEKLTGKQWPLETDAPLIRDLETYAAIYETDVNVLRKRAGWPAGRPYVPDPLGPKLIEAAANLTFGEEPEIIAGVPPTVDEDTGDITDDGDQPLMDRIVEENALPSELQRARAICGSEGEVWWRILVDREAADVPIIDWLSRRVVVPLWRGRRLLAAAFVSELDPRDPSERNVTYRYVETHAVGAVGRMLFLGSPGRIGVPVPLGDHPDTASLQDQPMWRNDLGVRLYGRIPNMLKRDPTVGVSDFAGVYELLLALNEASSHGPHNARMTLRKRVIVPLSAARADGGIDGAGGATVDDDDVLLVGPNDEFHEATGGAPARVLEYSDTWAQALSLHKQDMVDTILTRTGIAPQLVGLHTEGALTGPALRGRLLDSIQTANGKARYWDDEAPAFLMAAALVDALDEADGGFGRDWRDPAAPPTMRRRSILPQDPNDTTTRIVALAGADLMSRETALRELFPEWPEKRIREELDRLDNANTTSLTGAGNGGMASIRMPRPQIDLR